MLSYEEALNTVKEHSKPLSKISLPLSQALGFVLAESVRAKMPFPHFDNSAVDGFAIRWASNDQRKFKFKGE